MGHIRWGDMPSRRLHDELRVVYPDTSSKYRSHLDSMLQHTRSVRFPIDPMSHRQRHPDLET